MEVTLIDFPFKWMNELNQLLGKKESQWLNWFWSKNLLLQLYNKWTFLMSNAVKEKNGVGNAFLKDSIFQLLNCIVTYLYIS